MTFSILALDESTGAIGAAAVTGNLAVGAWVIRASADAGAVATQGHSVSPLWGDECLKRLAGDESAESILQSVTAKDSGAAWRQLSVLDRHGGVAAYTGDQNTAERGHRLSPGCVVAGNWLQSMQVLDTLHEVYRQSLGDATLSLSERLLAAITAAADVGGDSRGAQSAALKVVCRQAPPLDLRVDLHDRPLDALKELHERACSEPYAGWMQYVPTLDEPFRH